MKRVILLLVNLLLSIYLFSAESFDDLLDQLNTTIENRDVYLKEKYDRLQSIYESLDKLANPYSIAQRYNAYNKLYSEYETFIYDSAFKYAENMRELAYENNDFGRIAHSKVKLGFILMSSGMFHEALDTLYSIRQSSIPDSLKAEYYATMGKTNYGLAGFDNGYFSSRYITLGNQYMDSALISSIPNSLDYWLNMGIRKMNSAIPTDAELAFLKVIQNTSMSDHRYAIAASGLGFVYSLNGNLEKNKVMLVRAAIADIKASTKETVALRNLAEQLSKQDNIKASYRYIKIALENATFYNARQRKIEIARIMPFIEEAMLDWTRRTKALVTKYAIIITSLSFLIIFFVVVIFKQLRNLKKADAIIKEVNSSLKMMNNKLLESNKIKEEYIGYFFGLNSENIARVEKLQKTLKRNITIGRIDEIKNTINDIDLKKEREDFYKSFDQIFIKLFPNFVEQFNSFFKEEDRIIIKDNELLPGELRIFALIRMGIVDNERIAKILDYSVNTIYAYKTKTKNKSIIPNEEFEEKIMEIKAFG